MMGQKIALGISTLLGLLVLGFLGLVGAALIYDTSNPRDRPNAYLIEHAIEVDAPAEAAYEFLQHRIPDVYTEVAGMHARFEILNADALVPGAVVECEEGDENEVVRHRYVVTRVIPNRLLQMTSSPSIVLDRATGDTIAETDAEVYYDFEPLEGGRTRLTQTVVIDMLDPFHKALTDVAASVSGSRDAWSAQFV
ncbi:MAG: hypothetical protein GWM90_28295, partial [Gemmatimonadetes bacterium]|nr:SRPBCC family protein [Gemmatimonadota bacterium]NIQ58935.1 SRPBCC family protein [Gemmatimonadota bacterium]NIU79125.1 hypothetical protein [Gammaproteobacteria bacterium]NIX47829.1 hypothetical protein [Gemmatimonadota bacterium]NIY12194.1 hypothetical protein [Gemmatimonadota bacterium]